MNRNADNQVAQAAFSNCNTPTQEARASQARGVFDSSLSIAGERFTSFPLSELSSKRDDAATNSFRNGSFQHRIVRSLDRRTGKRVRRLQVHTRETATISRCHLLNRWRRILPKEITRVKGFQFPFVQQRTRSIIYSLDRSSSQFFRSQRY